MTYFSGSTKQLLILLEDVFAAGFSAGYHCTEAFISPQEDWQEYKKEHLSEYEPFTQEELSDRDTYNKHP